MRELEGVKQRWGEGGWRKYRVGGKQEHRGGGGGGVNQVCVHKQLMRSNKP